MHASWQYKSHRSRWCRQALANRLCGNKRRQEETVHWEGLLKSKFSNYIRIYYRFLALPMREHTRESVHIVGASRRRSEQWDTSKRVQDSTIFGECQKRIVFNLLHNFNFQQVRDEARSQEKSPVDDHAYLSFALVNCHLQLAALTQV